MLIYFWIGLGSAIGGMFRYGISDYFTARMPDFPWGTFIVNVTGSFLIGLFAIFATGEGRFLASPGWRQFFLIGFCGGYTTFSTFSFQTLTLIQNGTWMKAGLNIGGTVLLCLLFVWLGTWVAGLSHR